MSSVAVESVLDGRASIPWHDDIWRQLERAWLDNRWPHALLIHGLDGVGKYSLPLRIARSILCDKPLPNWLACGTCAACKLVQAHSHPDLLRVVPEEDKQSISVDQIRATCSNLALTSFRGGFKVAIVYPAHQMTTAAANSLLKTLEEPTPRTSLILVTSKMGALLPTLRSRCQHVAVRAPNVDIGQAWLSQTTGKQVSKALLDFVRDAPLRALQWADGSYEALAREVSGDLETLMQGRQDVTHIAKRWSDEQLVDRLRQLDVWLTVRLRASIVGTADPITGAPLPSGSRQLNISRLFTCLDRGRALQAQLGRTALQRELAVDALLIELLGVLIAK